MTEIYVAAHPTHRTVYHIKEDCRRIKDDPLEKDKHYVEWHELSLCKWCDPDRDTPLTMTEKHKIGDKKTVSALELPRDDAMETHELELYDPPASNGIGLKWKCDRCMRIYADWKVFEGEPCIPWGKR